MTTTKLYFSDIWNATLDQLNHELADAGWDSSHEDLYYARDAVGRLFNAGRLLELVDSDTNEVISDTVTDDQAAESCQTAAGHIDVDSRTCYVTDA